MEKAIFGSERIAHLGICLLSVLIMMISFSYGLGTLKKPGTGMYPFVVGLFIFPLSLSQFIGSLKQKEKGPILTRGEIRTFFSFIAACIFWIIAMPYLGYPLVTLVATFFLSKVMKLEGWFKPLLLSAGTALFIYILFDLWLYIDLPRGFWE